MTHGSLVLGLVEGIAPLPRRLEAPLVDRAPSSTRCARRSREPSRSATAASSWSSARPGSARRDSRPSCPTQLEDKATVLVGRCVSYGKGATYLPLAEIIRRGPARRALDELLAGDEHAELISARLADLIGEPEAPASGGETFWAVRRLFEALAAERPVVLVFEDLHWAEPTLLDLIDYFAEQVSAAPILAARPGAARPARGARRLEPATSRRGSRRSRARTARR